MNELVAWALQNARRQTLTLVEDLSEAQLCCQSRPGENHPAWILGHLLLGDAYLLFLLGVQELPTDFAELLVKYGPGTPSLPAPEHYSDKATLVERLSRTNTLRLEAIRLMKAEDFARPVPDEVLAQAQPTIGHHLLALVFHEGQHGGQLAAWRKAQGLDAIHGAFAPAGI